MENPTIEDTDFTPGRIARIMIWDDGKPTQVEMQWGLRPREMGDRPLSLLQAERHVFGNRCLIIATELWLRKGTLPNNKRRKVEMPNSNGFFCMAGTWRSASSGWPAAFAGITVEAYPDIEPFQDRHIAVIHEDAWIDWLKGERVTETMLRNFPIGTFKVSGPPAPASGDLFGAQD